MFWDRVVTLFQDTNASTSTYVVKNIPFMLKNDISLSWYLLLIEILEKRVSPIHEIIWKNALALVKDQKDLFGLLEVIQLAFPSPIHNIIGWKEAVENCVFYGSKINLEENYRRACLEVFIS